MNENKALVIDAFWADNRPFPSEISPISPAGTVLYAGYTGKFSHLGWMDMVQLKNLVKQYGISDIVLQNLDLLGKVISANKSVLNICTSYLCDSYLISYVPENHLFKRCIPIYNTSLIGGWDFSAEDEKIPIQAQNYMLYLLVHTHVNSVTYSTNKVTVTAYYSNDSLKLRSEKLE